MKAIKYFMFIAIVSVVFSCQKEDEFLDAKPNISLVVPSTLDDYQNLLYNEGVFNDQLSPGMGTVTTDEYYITPAYWAARAINERNLYIFKGGDIYETGFNFQDWSGPYTQVYYANTALEGINKLNIQQNQQTKYNQIKGQALFFRAHAFYNLLQTFAMPIDSARFTVDLGVPLRLTSDFNVSVQRSTIQQCYDQILSDLTTSVDLLPTKTDYPTQPCKAAGNALLARIYLAIRNYTKAYQYSDAALALNNTLVDYNTIVPLTTTLSPTYIKEDIFHAGSVVYSIANFSGGTMVDSVLYSFYDDPNDLRKSICYVINGGRVEFRGTYRFRGGKYCGLATDEIFLIRAECLARQGNISGAMADVNTLLRTRWKKNGTVSTYVDKTSSSAASTLALILKERRKELPFRGLRWTDIRRLNLEPGFQTTLTRTLNGVSYSLPPGDPRFALPIPPMEIQLSGIQQNQR
jgi:tetratricopeptide (TPR) repeat protein